MNKKQLREKISERKARASVAWLFGFWNERKKAGEITIDRNGSHRNVDGHIEAALKIALIEAEVYNRGRPSHEQLTTKKKKLRRLIRASRKTQAGV